MIQGLFLALLFLGMRLLVSKLAPRANKQQANLVLALLCFALLGIIGIFGIADYY
jgi:hypothetical protein